RAHLIERDIRRKSDAAFGRASRNRVLHAITLEYLDPPVVQRNRKVHGQLRRGASQHLAHAVIQSQQLRGLIEMMCRGLPRVYLLVDRRGRYRKHNNDLLNVRIQSYIGITGRWSAAALLLPMLAKHDRPISY